MPWTVNQELNNNASVPVLSNICLILVAKIPINYTFRRKSAQRYCFFLKLPNFLHEKCTLNRIFAIETHFCDEVWVKGVHFLRERSWFEGERGLLRCGMVNGREQEECFRFSAFIIVRISTVYRPYIYRISSVYRPCIYRGWIRGRCRVDVEWMQGRCGRDAGEKQGRCKGDAGGMRVDNRKSPDRGDCPDGKQT